jgi:hypothetical protein
MTGAEARLLRFLSAVTVHAPWVSYRTILNTEDLLPGDERALPMLMRRGLVEESAREAAYRLSEAGHKASGLKRENI